MHALTLSLSESMTSAVANQIEQDGAVFVPLVTLADGDPPLFGACARARACRRHAPR